MLLNCLVEFSIKQYSELLGKSKPASISTKKNIRCIIDEALCLLKDLSISTKEKRGAHHVVFNDIKILLRNSKCEKWNFYSSID